MEKVFAVVPAAGSGQRLGSASLGLPKALVPLHGDPLIVHTVTRLMRGFPFEQIVVPYPPEWVEYFRGIHFPSYVILTEGGATRQQSVRKGIEALGDLTDESMILIHDAARCFVSQEILVRAVEEAHRHGAVTVAIPSSDTLKQVDHHRMITGTLDRSTIWRTQTPQVFRWDILKRALAGVAQDTTDEASLVEAIHPVVCVEGAEENFKITYPLDLEIADYLLSKLPSADRD
jgi:2-C-methyl-D-erythritol 4-phosphate cytidylyltransferase